MQIINERSAGAVVFKQKNSELYFLLLHAKYKTAYWEFPKGLIEKNEKLEDAAKREIMEECGLKNVRFLEGFKEKITYYYRRGDKLIFKEVTYLLAESFEENVRISFEHIGYEWAKFEEALPKLRDNLKKVLVKAKDFIVKLKKDFGQTTLSK
jgi:NTP pyrophosphohydrolases including oxidative damage repair enzymes